MLGAAVGGIVLGWLGDRIGRVVRRAEHPLLLAVRRAGGDGHVPRSNAGPAVPGRAGRGGRVAQRRGPGRGVLAGVSRPVVAGMVGAAIDSGILLSQVAGVGRSGPIVALAVRLCCPRPARVVVLAPCRSRPAGWPPGTSRGPPRRFASCSVRPCFASPWSESLWVVSPWSGPGRQASG